MLNINLNHLIYFIKLSEVLNYTRAANLLHISQPTLTLAIQSLEKELGVELFEKSNRTLSLTNYGKTYLVYAKNAINNLIDGSNEIKKIALDYSGTISFAYIYTVGQNIGPNLAKVFLDENKDYKIDFKFMVGKTDEVIESIENGKADLAVCSYVNNPKIKFEPILTEDLVVVVPKDHILSKYSTLSLKDLTNFELIAYSKGSGLRTYLDELFIDEGLYPNIRFEIDEDTSMLGLVKNSFGIGIMPDLSIINEKEVKKIKLNLKSNKRKIYLAYKKTSKKNILLEKFISHIRENTDFYSLN